jgi:phage shock protein A
MALINRISRLFRADFHAVLDHIEEPDLMLKQALREMEEVILSEEQQMKQLLKDISTAEAKKQEINKSLNQYEAELDICFESNKHDLARRHIKRKLEMQRYENHLDKNIQFMKNLISELKQRLEENRSRFQSMQQKLDILTEDNMSHAKDEFRSEPGFVIHDDEVEVEFLREKQNRGTL